MNESGRFERDNLRIREQCQSLAMSLCVSVSLLAGTLFMFFFSPKFIQQVRLWACGLVSLHLQRLEAHAFPCCPHMLV